MVIVDWALVITSAGLLVATSVLVYVTRTLAQHTRRLVWIEKRRDRRNQIRSALESAERVEKIVPGDFVSELEHSRVPQREANHIRQLALNEALISKVDDESPKILRKLRQILDDLDREGSQISIGENGPQIERDLRVLKDRLAAWSIPEWRGELARLE